MFGYRAPLVCVFAIAILSGCSGDSTSPPVRPSGLPEDLAITYTSVGAWTSTIEVDNGQVTFKRLEYPSDESIEEATITPSIAAWNTFWTEIDQQASLWKWRAEYRHPEISGGASWQVRVTDGSFHLESEGLNGYPNALGEDGGTSATAQFQAFLDAIGHLIGRPFPRST